MKTARARLPYWLDRLQPSESLVLITAAVIVGVCSGAGVWVFKGLIELIGTAANGPLADLLAPLGGWTQVLLPVVGGMLVGLIVHFFVGAERHHGVAGIMEAVALAGGRLRYWRMPAKAVASAISIGTGGGRSGRKIPRCRSGPI
jgi:CIC family chloride channel protein